MRELFDVADLVRIGVEDETSGVAFYDHVASKSANPELKKMFLNLAGQERYHKKRFETMLEALGARPQREEYPGEYAQYLQTLTEGRAFPNPKAALRKADQCVDDAQAVELAMHFERDTPDTDERDEGDAARGGQGDHQRIDTRGTGAPGRTGRCPARGAGLLSLSVTRYEIGSAGRLESCREWLREEAPEVWDNVPAGIDNYFRRSRR